MDLDRLHGRDGTPDVNADMVDRLLHRRWSAHLGGLHQLRASTPDDWVDARRLGVATSSTLLIIDAIYVPRGVISRTYLFDAAAEVALLAAGAFVSRSQAEAAHK